MFLFGVLIRGLDSRQDVTVLLRRKLLISAVGALEHFDIVQNGAVTVDVNFSFIVLNAAPWAHYSSSFHFLLNQP